MYVYHTTMFKKMYNRLDKRIQKKADERLMLFVTNSLHTILNNHPLTDEWAGCRSINVTGDFRIVYRERGENIFSLEAIGTHNQLYGS